MAARVAVAGWVAAELQVQPKQALRLASFPGRQQAPMAGLINRSGVCLDLRLHEFMLTALVRGALAQCCTSGFTQLACIICCVVAVQTSL